MMAKSFLANGYGVIILDVLSDETKSLYREHLRKFEPKLIQLLPTFGEIERRNETRPPRLTYDELNMVYEGQASLSVYDTRIDNTDMSPDEIADAVLELIDTQPKS